MFKDELRPYEISLWTLQDSFITVLKPNGIFNKGQIETPNCVIKNDGTQELKFSIPMYYYENNALVENPIWYNVINGALIVNLRKLKVIFNKGESEEEVFEFVINEITETHTNGQLKCNVFAEGLAFQELGKVGYKISLLSQDYLDEYNEWYEKTVGEGEDFDYPSEEAKAKDEPINNLNYWCEKIFKNSRWSYEIQMDWSAFDGQIVDLKTVNNTLREEKGFRRTDKIYEEEYISSWEDKDGVLVPSKMESFKEKLRLVDLEKSNKYNLTQELAKTFGVFCKYKYLYDENYHITERKCIFYNNFLTERDGKIDITYPYSTSKIERKLDSSDIVTKMFVTPMESDSSPSGLITIADVTANKSKEDYILNFDYLYTVGTISQEQYDAIPDYERSMFLLNSELDPIAAQLANLENDLVIHRAQQATSREAQIQDKDQMTQAKQAYDNIINNETFLTKNIGNPIRGILLKEEDKDSYYVNITQEGIDCQGENKYILKQFSEKNEEGVETTQTVYAKGLRLFYYAKVDETINKILKPYEDDPSKNPDLPGKEEPDKIAIYPPSVGMEFKDGNLVRLTGLKLKQDAYNSSIFITCAYSPKLHYQNIYEYYAKKLVEDENLEKEATAQIEEIEEKKKKLNKKYEELLEKKTLIVTDFENMMGPALREGSWQAETYTDYGSKYEKNITVGVTNETSHLNFFWDVEPFDEEQLLYYLDTGAEDGKTWFYAINLHSLILNKKEEDDKIKKDNFLKNLDKISLIYDRVSINGKEEEFLNTYYYTIGSQLKYAFIQSNDIIIPLLLITEKTFSKKGEGYAHKNFRVGVVTTSTIEKDGTIEVEEKIEEIEKVVDSDWIETLSKEKQVYPRIKSNTLLLKTSEDELIIKYNEEVLKNYYDYSILIRDTNYLITLKDIIMLKEGIIEKTFNITYAISNASLALFLDAVEVAKTNAAPQVSYTLEISAMNRNFIHNAYKNLNRIVGINDSELKFEDVQGYISELDLNLDNPWEDKVVIQNYKTKFEDLFSTIVASSEQMKVNSFAYDNAANSFGPGGTLKPSIIQNTINKVDLTYAFQKGNLTIDEVNGIWARSDAGVVAMRGGGIFCATEQDSNGNWIWNTGIMPSGINASLITAGQLDTNLIKIFAGDDLRLQLNADGLFAYKSDSLGQADPNRYIVHNSEGLFSTIVKNNGDKINLVEVSWDGFKLRDQSGNFVFNADMEGNLAITGTITAKNGYIGPWKITDTGLWSDDGKAGITIKGKPTNEESPSLDSHEKMIWVTGTKNNNGTVNEFLVTADGTLYCSDIIARGIISADSFIGNTSGEDIDKQLRNISIAILDSTTFSFNNRNYDGNLVVSPEQLKFRIYTNALTDNELTSSEYQFYYGIGDSEETVDWIEIKKDENGNYPDYLIWEPNYLTFRLKSDIMYLGIEESSIRPQSLLYFKVAKKGLKREVISQTDIKYQEVTEYSSVIQLVSETFGIGKYITPINPPSFTFIADANNEKYYEETKTFFVELTGFEETEVQERAYWRIEGEEKEYHYSVVGEKTNFSSDIVESSSAVLISDEDEIIIDGEVIENDSTSLDEINGNNSSDDDKLTIAITKEEQGENSKIIASATISYDKVPEGGNLSIIFCIDAATRQTICFRIRNGSDGTNVVLRSSSGTALTNGDTETELSVEIYYGQQQINGDNTTKEFFYVWKKDGVALSSILEKVLTQEENEEGEIVLKESLQEIVRPDIFTKKKIIIKASDFNLKSDYSCHVYTSLENKKGESGTSSAIEDYKQKNEIQEVDLNKTSAPIYISKQPENMYAKEGEPCSTTVFVKGYNLNYQWYYKDIGMTSFSESSIKNPTYRVNKLENERIGRTVYCEITGTNLDGSGSYKIVSNQVTLNLKE